MYDKIEQGKHIKKTNSVYIDNGTKLKTRVKKVK